MGTAATAARQHAVTRLDSLDHTHPVIDVANQHTVAGDHGVSLVADQRTHHLANRAFEMTAVFELNSRLLADGTQHAAHLAVSHVDINL